MKSIKAWLKSSAGRFGYSVTKAEQIIFPEIRSFPRYLPCEVNLLGQPFRVSDAPSFLASHKEIFEDQIYRFETANSEPRIIDCGANYGVSVRYFKSIYPHARVTAIEADPRIFGILETNLRGAQISDVELLHRAVSDTDAFLTFFSEGADAGRMHENASAVSTTSVKGITLDELIDGPVEFLKIDIEGAETAALRACTKLSLVDQIFVEYHSFADQPQLLAELLDILEKNNFRYFIHTQLCSPNPLTVNQVHMGMDMQLNIFAKRAGSANLSQQV